MKSAYEKLEEELAEARSIREAQESDLRRELEEAKKAVAELRSVLNDKETQYEQALRDNMAQTEKLASLKSKIQTKSASVQVERKIEQEESLRRRVRELEEE